MLLFLQLLACWFFFLLLIFFNCQTFTPSPKCSPLEKKKTTNKKTSRFLSLRSDTADLRDTWKMVKRKTWIFKTKSEHAGGQNTLSGVLNAFTKCTIFLRPLSRDTEIVALFVILVHRYLSGGLSLLFRTFTLLLQQLRSHLNNEQLGLPAFILSTLKRNRVLHGVSIICCSCNFKRWSLMTTCKWVLLTFL